MALDTFYEELNTDFFSMKSMCYWFQIWRDSFQNQPREVETQQPLVWFVLLIKSFQDTVCHYNTLNWLLGKENGKMTYSCLQNNNMCLLVSRQIQPLNSEATVSDRFSDQFRLRKQTTDKIAQVCLRMYVNEALSMKQNGSNSGSTTYWLPINNPLSS